MCVHVCVCEQIIAHHTITVTHCGVHACTLWATCLELQDTCLVCHGHMFVVGYMPCLSLAVALCGVHTLFVTDCCTLWGTYLVCH